MRLIAHRVFKDHRPIEPFRADGAPQVAGVELDIRTDADGIPRVDHAPLFMLGSRRLGFVPKSLHAAVHFLAREVPGLEVLLLDIKSLRSAEAVAAHFHRHPPPFPLAFACWHADEAAALRRHFPKARIYFCLVPIFSERLGRGRFSDLYLCNSFPFVTPHPRFRPKLDKPNRHNVNVRLIAPDAVPEALLPEGIDGLCVHRLFCKPDLVGFAAARGLGLAVYGLDGRDRRRLERLRAFADLAIIRNPPPGRPGRTSRNLHSAP